MKKFDENYKQRSEVSKQHPDHVCLRRFGWLRKPRPFLHYWDSTMLEMRFINFSQRTFPAPPWTECKKPDIRGAKFVGQITLEELPT